MPESAKDRPTSASEMIWMLAKSNTAQYWTHRDLPGTRTKPKPDYRYVRASGEKQIEEPEGWKTNKILCPACGGTREVTVQLEGDLIGETVIPCELCNGKKDSLVREWTRINLWRGHDYFYDSEAVKERSVTGDTRRPYMSQGAKDLDGRMEWHSGELRENCDGASRNLRNVWTINPQPSKKAHFAVMPENLVRPCVQLGTSEHGVCGECGAPWARVEEIGWRPTCKCGGGLVPAIVLDPFAGSGTVGVVCAKLGRSSIGVELNPGYVEMARERIADATRQSDLFV